MRNRFDFPELSGIQIVMWIVVVSLMIFVEFIWVPYRLEDGSVDWSWRWDLVVLHKSGLTLDVSCKRWIMAAL